MANQGHRFPPLQVRIRHFFELPNPRVLLAFELSSAGTIFFGLLATLLGFFYGLKHPGYDGFKIYGPILLCFPIFLWALCIFSPIFLHDTNANQEGDKRILPLRVREPRGTIRNQRDTSTQDIQDPATAEETDPDPSGRDVTALPCAGATDSDPSGREDSVLRCAKETDSDPLERDGPLLSCAEDSHADSSGRDGSALPCAENTESNS